GEYGVEMLVVVGGLLIWILVIGVVGNYLEVGFMLRGERVKMKLRKMEGMKGLKNILWMPWLV
uniref:EscU/YscU/HrcU family type III secretion system export apparatus switch protein n=1 Tax=Geobacillus sp. (strain Y412MC10) TaxID=481743 RepID=UPI0016426635